MRIFRVVMRIDQSLLDQQPAEAMTQQNQRSVHCILPFRPDRFQKLIRLVDKGTPILAIDDGGIVLVKEDARVGYVLWQIVAKP